MNVQTATLFFALLAILAQAVVVAAALGALAAAVVPSLRPLRRRVVAAIAPQATAFATVVAVVCTAGSLYLSEVAHFVPCRLCWIQRGFMYPLVLVLGLAAITRSRALRTVGLVAAALGGCVSIYHVLIERFPDIEPSGTCELTNPCSAILVERAGYVTIPTMALSGFALIVTLLLVARAQPAPEAS
jgi:disulfide bond formation protein DsbB